MVVLFDSSSTLFLLFLHTCSVTHCNLIRCCCFSCLTVADNPTSVISGLYFIRKETTLTLRPFRTQGSITSFAPLLLHDGQPGACHVLVLPRPCKSSSLTWLGLPRATVVSVLVLSSFPCFWAHVLSAGEGGGHLLPCYSLSSCWQRSRPLWLPPLGVPACWPRYIYLFNSL